SLPPSATSLLVGSSKNFKPLIPLHKIENYYAKSIHNWTSVHAEETKVPPWAIYYFSKKSDPPKRTAY
ncbi:MAG: hypothetical protein ACPGQF_08625, partial [Akkermansiaceae bacterium]